VAKILNGANEDATLDKRNGPQRAVAGWVAGQSAKAALDRPPRDPFTGLPACRRPLRCAGSVVGKRCHNGDAIIITVAG